MTDLALFVLLVIAVEAVTEVLVAAKITDGLRAYLFTRAFPPVPEDHPEGEPPPVGGRGWRFFQALLQCGYCTSVWVAMPFAIAAPSLLPWCANWLVMVFALHRLSNWLHVAYEIIKKGRVKTYDLDVKVKHDGSPGSPGCPASDAP